VACRNGCQWPLASSVAESNCPTKLGQSTCKLLLGGAWTNQDKLGRCHTSETPRRTACAQDHSQGSTTMVWTFWRFARFLLLLPLALLEK
jgi:hypothetical protein